MHHLLSYCDSCLYWCLAYICGGIFYLCIYIAVTSMYPRDQNVTIFLLVGHRIWCKLTKSQEFYSILIHRSIPLLQHNELLLHLFLSHCREEALIEAFRELSQEKGFSSLASSASHQVLATSFSCILTIFTCFLLGILAAFKRLVISICHCFASRGFSVPEKTIGCNLLKSDTVPGLCSRAAVNNPCRKSSVCCYWLFIIPWSTVIISSFSLLELSREMPGPLHVPCLSISELAEKEMERRSWKEKMEGF